MIQTELACYLTGVTITCFLRSVKRQFELESARIRSACTVGSVIVLTTYLGPARSFGRRGGMGQISFHARHANAASDGGAVSCSSFPRVPGGKEWFAQVRIQSCMVTSTRCSKKSPSFPRVRSGNPGDRQVELTRCVMLKRGTRRSGTPTTGSPPKARGDDEPEWRADSRLLRAERTDWQDRLSEACLH